MAQSERTAGTPRVHEDVRPRSRTEKNFDRHGFTITDFSELLEKDVTTTSSRSSDTSRLLGKTKH